MKKLKKKPPSHITKGNVLLDLGFSENEARLIMQNGELKTQIIKLKKRLQKAKKK